MKDNFVGKLYSPWIVMGISVTASVAIFLIVTLVTDIPITSYALLLSSLIPAVISFPVSAVLISYHKRIERQKFELERLNELNNRLFSIIAHDIKSPVASAYSVMELLKSEDIDDNERKVFINDLSGSFDNLLVFLNDILEWSKQQIESQELEPNVFDADAIVDRILTLYKYMIEEKEIKIKKDLSSTDVYANEGSYSLIIRNLIHNAIKFTPRNGSISINTHEDEHNIHTVIADSGVGISQENLDKILNGKDWVSSTGTNNEKGSGFGLQASIRYVELQKGQIHIESDKDKGTSVRISLPKKNDHFA